MTSSRDPGRRLPLVTMSRDVIITTIVLRPSQWPQCHIQRKRQSFLSIAWWFNGGSKGRPKLMTILVLIFPLRLRHCWYSSRFCVQNWRLHCLSILVSRKLQTLCTISMPAPDLPCGSGGSSRPILLLETALGTCWGIFVPQTLSCTPSLSWPLQTHFLYPPLWGFSYSIAMIGAYAADDIRDKTTYRFRNTTINDV